MRRPPVSRRAPAPMAPPTVLGGEVHIPQAPPPLHHGRHPHADGAGRHVPGDHRPGGGDAAGTHGDPVQHRDPSPQPGSGPDADLALTLDGLAADDGGGVAEFVVAPPHQVAHGSDDRVVLHRDGVVMGGLEEAFFPDAHPGADGHAAFLAGDGHLVGEGAVVADVKNAGARLPWRASRRMPVAQDHTFAQGDAPRLAQDDPPCRRRSSPQARKCRGQKSRRRKSPADPGSGPARRLISK